MGLSFYTCAQDAAATEKMRIDSSGNVGVGVTPSAWASSYKAFQIGQSASLSGFSSELAVFGSNCYFDTTDSRWERITSGFTSQYYQTSGTHVWRIGGTAGANTDCAFTQAMTLDASGNLLVGVASANANGGVLQLKSGITFPATQVASSDANTLDDYEEGTFTPTIQGSTTTGVGTYVANTGRYTKVGNLVTFQVYIEWTAHTGVGNMRIGGLPFTNTANFWAGSVGYANNIALTAGNIMTGYVESSSSFVTLSQYPTGGGVTTGVPVDTAGAIIFSASYTV
jgi:hypothetical protein